DVVMKNRWTTAAVSALIISIHDARPGPTVPAALARQDTKPAPGDGKYPPVDKEQLLGRHDCWATGSFRTDFHFQFLKDRFEIEAQGAPMPREVLDTLVGAGKKAKKIQGRWELADGTLRLTKIEADGYREFKDVNLKPVNTGVVRLDFGKTQYVLGPRK